MDTNKLLLLLKNNRDIQKQDVKERASENVAYRKMKPSSNFTVNHLLQAVQADIANISEKERAKKLEESKLEENDVDILSPVVKPESTPESTVYNDVEEAKVALEDVELWRKFQGLTNEMIVTKNGR